MKVAVIGAGGWGKNIVRTLHALGALDSVTELNPALREQLVVDYPGIPVYDDIDSMLTATDSPIALATPVPTHYAIGKKLLQAKRNLFIEKPMAMNQQECAELNALATENNCTLMVGHLLIYQSAIQFIKTFLQEQKLGKLFSIYQVRRNLGTVRTHENALYSLGVHDIAVLDFLIGEQPTEVKAAGQAILQDGIEDDVSLSLTYPDGLKASLHTSWLWPIKERYMVLSGEKGMLKFDELTQTITLYAYDYTDGVLTKAEPEVVFADKASPLDEELKHFMACCETKETPKSNGLQGERVVAILEGALQNLGGMSDKS